MTFLKTSATWSLVLTICLWLPLLTCLCWHYSFDYFVMTSVLNILHCFSSRSRVNNWVHFSDSWFDIFSTSSLAILTLPLHIHSWLCLDCLHRLCTLISLLTFFLSFNPRPLFLDFLPWVPPIVSPRLEVFHYFLLCLFCSLTCPWFRLQILPINVLVHRITLASYYGFSPFHTFHFSQFDMIGKTNRSNYSLRILPWLPFRDVTLIYFCEFNCPFDLLCWLLSLTNFPCPLNYFTKFSLLPWLLKFLL